VENVDLLFGGTASFLVSCDGKRDGALCLLAAMSVLLVRPLSVVNIVMEDGDPSKYLAHQQEVINALGKGHMSGLIQLHDQGSVSIDELVAAAPNNRTFLMAPEMMFLEAIAGEAQDCWSRESDNARTLCVPESMDVLSKWKFIAEDYAVRNTSTHAFQSFQPIQQGKFPLDRSRLASWALLCSRPLWLEAINSVSDWRRFCASLNKSNRKLQNITSRDKLFRG
jgi:hypothetical protein